MNFGANPIGGGFPPPTPIGPPLLSPSAPIGTGHSSAETGSQQCSLLMAKDGKTEHYTELQSSSKEATTSENLGSSATTSSS